MTSGQWNTTPSRLCLKKLRTTFTTCSRHGIAPAPASQRVSGMFRLVGVNAAVALRYIQFRWSAPLLRRTLGQSAKQHIMADALRRAASGRYANEMAAAASAVERLQPDEDADRTTTDTCGGKGAAMTDIERLWRLFLEHSTLQNFDRIYPVVSDQFGPLNCDGVSVRGCQPSKK